MHPHVSNLSSYSHFPSLSSVTQQNVFYNTDNKIMSIFRAVLRSGEKSQRVIDLTELILDENAANYTVW